MLRLMKKYTFVYYGYMILVLGLMYPLLNHDRLTRSPASRFIFWVFPGYQYFLDNICIHVDA